MDSTEKLLRKISKDDRAILNKLTDDLQVPLLRKNMDILKLADSDYFRVRKGKFRAIFHFEGKEAIVDSVRLRNEKTYRDL
ncbi:MAG: hypothetical protein A2845_03945 [Candidatus Lloydbacteria bacterium RIFCSPHIGHO2_01_FULL_49_22]|uniref:Cytotoxic translational repressor of toxin-antitoxin stability system n=1 Tax=Candidatus Lloydbacteria bacterium RIFCSPHIGHO2_01_FULL_49_22 TaxID=1798658 RepID=A0A1G2CX22_9BACT|nr:MAG: hypothetical protein A2845_03945 [Candidatus Lloydbacteria bacterium RIFCSPHIGHO2_01_FULL_49_22]OGZ09079.1 MAG: hypothetical protein A3C14_03780 [Candidatus Lloydbacteria bacterium RIFCSPHIGHO2_02_FULL_50_18]